MTDERIRVYAIDFDAHRLKLLSALINSESYLVVSCTSLEDFLRTRLEFDIGCLIVDLHLPGLLGGELVKRLREAGSDLAVIVVADAADVESTVQVMREGALTVLERPITAAALSREIERGVEQSRTMHTRRVQCESIRKRLATLSPEERDVLTLVIAGSSNKVIAQELAVGMRTVERHRSQVFRKMQVGSIAELARLMSTWD